MYRPTVGTFGEAMTNACLRLLVSLPFLFDQTRETLFHRRRRLSVRPSCSCCRAAQIPTDSLGFHCPYQVPLRSPFRSHCHTKGVLCAKGGWHNSARPSPTRIYGFLMRSYWWMSNIVSVKRGNVKWAARQFIIGHFGAATDILSFPSVLTADLSVLLSSALTGGSLVALHAPPSGCSTLLDRGEWHSKVNFFGSQSPT